MKLPWLIQQVFHEPSLITPEAHASLRQFLQHRLGDTEEARQRTGTNICGEEVELASMEVRDGIAHIPVAGVIGHKLSGFAKGRGAVDVADIAADLDEAQADPRVRGALLEFDSPGGMVAGTPELADRIAEFSKPIYAFTDSMIASAAYWLAASTDGIFSTRTAAIGSIGVYIPFYDETKAYEKEGVSVELIKAGKLKGTGFPGLPLTKEQRAHLQERVDAIYTDFTSHVTARRPGVNTDSMQGQTFPGSEAYRRKLVDAVVRSSAEVVSIFPADAVRRR